MLFDDMPGAFDTGAIGEASLLAGVIEATHTRNLHHFGEALVAAGKERADTEGVTSEVAQLLMADGLACQLWLGSPEVVARWNNTALVPFMEFPEGVFPPPLRTFPDSLRPYFERRADEAQADDRRARYADFVWLRWRSFDHARVAIPAYLAAGADSDLMDSMSTSSAMDYLVRSAHLSAQLNIEKAATADVVFSQVERSIGGPSLGFTCKVVEGSKAILATDPDRARTLMESLAAAAEAANDADGHSAQSLFEAASHVADALRDRDARDGYMRCVAESFELEADRRKGEGGLVVLGLLVEALRIYTKLNDGDQIQRLKEPMARAAKTASDETKEIGSTVTVDLKEVNAKVDAFARTIDDGTGSLLQLGLGFGLWPTWEKLREDFDRARADNPIQWLVTRFTITPTGEINLPADDEQLRDEQNLLDFFGQQIQFKSVDADLAIRRLRETGHWDASIVGTAFGAVEPSWRSAMATGLAAYESGDYWTACHVFVPQLERMMRGIGLSVSANVRALLRDGALQFVTLGTMLADPVINQVLGAGFCKSFDAAFCDPRGLNIRNRTAHGLLDPAADQKIPATLALLAALALAFMAEVIDKKLRESNP